MKAFLVSFAVGVLVMLLTGNFLIGLCVSLIVLLAI